MIIILLGKCARIFQDPIVYWFASFALSSIFVVFSVLRARIRPPMIALVFVYVFEQYIKS